MDWNIALDDERTLSVEQFCQVEGLSRDEFEFLYCFDAAPRMLFMTRKNEITVRRITPEARRQWHEKLRGYFWNGKQVHGVTTRIEYEIARPPDPNHAKES